MKRFTSLGRALLVAGLVMLPAVHAQTSGPAFWHGSPADPQSAGRVVNIQPDTRWVNVEQGESVRFISGSSQFAWRFDGRDGRSFNLQIIAPAGALARPVMVYVARSPGHPA